MLRLRRADARDGAGSRAPRRGRGPLTGDGAAPRGLPGLAMNERMLAQTGPGRLGPRDQGEAGAVTGQPGWRSGPPGRQAAPTGSSGRSGAPSGAHRPALGRALPAPHPHRRPRRLVRPPSSAGGKRPKREGRPSPGSPSTVATTTRCASGPTSSRRCALSSRRGRADAGVDPPYRPARRRDDSGEHPLRARPAVSGFESLMHRKGPHRRPALAPLQPFPLP